MNSNRPSCSANPIARSAFEIHDREDTQFVSGNGVQEPIGEPLTQSSPDRTQDCRTCLGMIGDCFGAAKHFRDEGGAQPRLFKFIVPSRVVEFALGQLVEGDAHRSDPGARLAKHLIGRTARQRA